MDQWFAGNFELCLDMCGTVTERNPDILAQVALLRARALLRLRRPDDALRVLESSPWPESGDVFVAARMLIGAALIRSNEVDRGVALLEELQASATEAHRTIRSEIALTLALGYFCRREVDAADRALDMVSADSDIIYARALEYRGWVASRRAEFERAVRYFRAALDALDRCKHYDRYLEANCTHVLASLAVELLDPPTWEVVVQRRAAIDWSAQEIRRQCFRITLSAATYAYEVEGADFVAINEAREAETLAPTPAARVEALCRRAATAGRAAERLGQLDHTEEAYGLFCSLDVQRLDDHDKLVPLVLAKELAIAGRVDRARRVFSLYREHCQTRSLLAVTGNPAGHAFERLVDGLICEAASERTRARRAYLDSFTQFRAIDYRRRAVHAALRLGALLNEPELFDYADKATRHLAPRSWLRQQVESLPTDVILRRLSAARREVLHLLCRGFTVPEIATLRGRSSKTVANTVTEVYRAFKVRNRAELLTELLRRGIIRPT